MEGDESYVGAMLSLSPPKHLVVTMANASTNNSVGEATFTQQQSANDFPNTDTNETSYPPLGVISEANSIGFTLDPHQLPSPVVQGSPRNLDLRTLKPSQREAYLKKYDSWEALDQGDGQSAAHSPGSPTAKGLTSSEYLSPTQATPYNLAEMSQLHTQSEHDMQKKSK